MKKRAMVLAAGMGTRLGELTSDRPKALVEYHGKSLLEIVLRRLIHHGFRDIIINIHHFPDQIIKFTESKKNFGVNIIFSDESDQLLDTGGGIKKAEWFFENEPVLIHNVDVYTDLNLDGIYSYHNASSHIATLAVKKRETTRPFLRNKYGLLCGWENIPDGEKIITSDDEDPERIAYSGIGVLNPEFIRLLPEGGKYPLTPEILRISKTHEIGLLEHSGIWRDMGKPEGYIN